jgi:hypothetical protein
MNTVMGTYKNGQVILNQPADWPEGTEVLIEPISQKQTLGIRDEHWPADPEGIARHLALMDRIEPLEMTPEEEAAWQAARQAQKELATARWEEHSRKIERLFE